MILKNMICVAGFCLITLSGQAAGKPEVPPYKDKTVSIEKRVDDLMGRMTLREKVLQLHPHYNFCRRHSGNPAK